MLTDSSGMDWSTMYANALAQMLNDKSITGGNSSSHSDVITLPQNRSAVATTAAQQAPATSDSDSPLKNLLTQASPSQQGRLPAADLLASALRSHSPNHSLAVSTSMGGGASPKRHTQDIQSNNSIPQLPSQNHDLQTMGNLTGLSADKVEGSKQRLSPYHMVPSEQQLSPNTAALGLANQKSPSRQQGGSVDVKEGSPLATGIGTAAAMAGKDELMLEDTKLFLKQLAQQQLPQQPQKSMPGSIVIPGGGGGSDQQEELTIHPGGSGELVMMSHYITSVL